MEKKITSKVEPLVYFRQYLTIVNPLYDLSPRERDVLAYLLYLDYQYKDIPEKAREKLIFDYDSKVAISNEYDIPMATVNNIMTSLRKKDYHKESFILGKRINYRVPMLPKLDNAKNSLTFEFVVE